MFEKHGARRGVNSSSQPSDITRADSLMKQRRLLEHDATFLINRASGSRSLA